MRTVFLYAFLQSLSVAKRQTMKKLPVTPTAWSCHTRCRSHLAVLSRKAPAITAKTSQKVRSIWMRCSLVFPGNNAGLKSCESIIQRSRCTVSMNRWEPIWMAFDRLMNPACSNASMAVNRSSGRCSDNGDALFQMAARENQ